MKNRIAERKRLRLSGYDYSSDGYYFVTICTQNRECFFGEIKNGIMGLNEIGNIATRCLQDIPNHFCDVKLFEWIVMPNHMHVIVILEQQFNQDTFVIGTRGHVGDRHACPKQYADNRDRHACPYMTNRSNHNIGYRQLLLVHLNLRQQKILTN